MQLHYTILKMRTIINRGTLIFLRFSWIAGLKLGGNRVRTMNIISDYFVKIGKKLKKGDLNWSLKNLITY